MTMHIALYSRDDINRLYMSRKEERKGITNIEDCVDTPILDYYIKMIQERQITALTTQGQTELKQSLKNRNGKKNNFMNISSDKLAKTHTRRHGHS